MSLNLAVRPFNWAINKIFILTQPTATLTCFATPRCKFSIAHGCTSHHRECIHFISCFYEHILKTLNTELFWHPNVFLPFVFPCSISDKISFTHIDMAILMQHSEIFLWMLNFLFLLFQSYSSWKLTIELTLSTII